MFRSRLYPILTELFDEKKTFEVIEIIDGSPPHSHGLKIIHVLKQETHLRFVPGIEIKESLSPLGSRP